MELFDKMIMRKEGLVGSKGKKRVAMDLYGEVEEQSGGLALAMDVDGIDSPLEFFGDGSHSADLHRCQDSDFFNSFEDDFDDQDIN